jgi:hypothetical protein
MAIFGKNEEEVVEDKKASTSSGEKVTMSKTQFDALMDRLSRVESEQTTLSHTVNKTDVFNPLEEVKTDHIVRVSYFEDKLVVGYKPKVLVDGRTVFITPVWNESEQRMRNNITLLLENEDGKIEERVVDHIAFLEGSIQIDAKLKERKDIGKLIEHGTVEATQFNGRTMAGTGDYVMTGTKEQHFAFTIEHKGKIYQMPEEVINIR